MEDQVPAQRPGHGFPGDVITGRSQTTHHYDQLRPAKGFTQPQPEVLSIIAHYRLEGHRPPEIVQASAEVQRIRILEMRGEKLGADRDDLDSSGTLIYHCR